MTTPPPAPDTAPRLAAALGSQYDVRRLVGHGGFADVYEVWDRELERRLAVKVLRPDIAWTPGTLARFKEETRAIARLEHSNILAIHFVGEAEGIVYYAMPYIEGQSLGDLLRRSGPLPADRALDIAMPVLDALAHAHEQGLIHRDLKPDNIMLDHTRGRPLLVDFGIAKRLDADGGITQTGLVVGTPHYMSPEQALGERNLDARSDLYSMGAVLFQMMTGAPPFDADSSQEIVGKHITEPPRPPAEVNAEVPVWLSDAITRCLEKKPARRFQSARDLLAALEAGRGPAPVRATGLRSAAAGVGTPTLGAETDVVPSGERTHASAPRRSRTRAVRRLALVVLPVLFFGSLTVWWISRPRLVFANRLAAAVTVTAGETRRVVDAGARLAVPLRRGRPLTAIWSLVRPTDTEGRPLGVAIADTFDVRRPRGRVHRAAEVRVGKDAYFAPLITNNTGRALTVTINAGLAGATSCGCAVPSGAVRMLIGYYPLYANSTVRVETPEGLTAMFQDLGPEVDPATGVVGLRFEAGDLR